MASIKKMPACNNCHDPTQPQDADYLAHPKYRPDIDGLRAIAVLSVVGFHAFPSWVPGGFVGVDVFFVISGFLISTIILNGLDHNTFSFIEFYSRRIRRIFPALLTVLVACFAFGWFALLADEYKLLGKHIAGGAGFVSNFLLWQESGYFDISAETKPLLHLWSLGIEEQFYIIWPLLLWLAWKKSLNLLGIIAVVATISFALNIAKYHSDSVASFYSPQTRFWELAVGSVLAYISLHNRRLLTIFTARSEMPPRRISYFPATLASPKILRDIQSILGAFLIVIGIFMITKERHFPGFWAVLPVLGAVMIIAAGAHAWLNRVLLSNRVLVWFGLVSFPLYLWHWPLLSFARIVESETPLPSIRIAAVLVSIAFAWLTYRLIEKPLRFGTQQKAKTVALIILMVMVGYIGFNTFERDGLEFRGNTSRQELMDLDFNLQRGKAWLCNVEDFKETNCLLEGNQPPTTVIMGDSHATAIYWGLNKLYKQQGKQLALFGGGGGCLPYIDLISEDAPNANNRRCMEKTQAAIREVIANKTIKEIIITSRGPLYTTGKGLGEIDHKRIMLRLKGESYGQRSNKESLRLAMTNTLSAMRDAGKNVIYLHDVPELGFDIKKCLSSRPFEFRNKFQCSVNKSSFNARYGDFRMLIDGILMQFPNVKIINLADALCDDTSCHAKKGHRLLYRDDDHLSKFGSEYVVDKLKSRFPP